MGTGGPDVEQGLWLQDPVWLPGFLSMSKDEGDMGAAGPSSVPIIGGLAEAQADPSPPVRGLEGPG